MEPSLASNAPSVQTQVVAVGDEIPRWVVTAGAVSDTLGGDGSWSGGVADDMMVIVMLSLGVPRWVLGGCGEGARSFP